jgi:hypothetical protein
MAEIYTRGVTYVDRTDKGATVFSFFEEINSAAERHNLEA